MIRAVQKQVPDSNIVDMDKLKNIVNDPEFKSKICANTTFVEKGFF